MAVEVDFAPLALRDFDSILENTAEDNPKAALRLVQQLRRCCLQLRDLPERGVAVGQNRRRLVVGRYLILYRLTTSKRSTAKKVEILRVLHGMRNLPESFRA